MNYFRPQELSQALHWLNDHQAGIAAGCTDLFALTQAKMLHKDQHEYLLDITAIGGLNSITHGPDEIRIGAATCWSNIIDADLPASFDGLKAAAREIGSVQIQNSGTIGGNLCNASPAADGVPPLLTLDARVELVSSEGKRELPLQDFILGPRTTALAKNELLSAVIVPKSSQGGVSDFSKLGARKYLVISIAMVAVRFEIDNGLITHAAISVGSCSAVACRMSSIEDALVGKPVTANFSPLITDEIVHANLAPIDDIRADAPYRLVAAREIIVRTISALLDTGNFADET